MTKSEEMTILFADQNPIWEAFQDKEFERKSISSA